LSRTYMALKLESKVAWSFKKPNLKRRVAL
jgi:hypothetical protein